MMVVIGFTLSGATIITMAVAGTMYLPPIQYRSQNPFVRKPTRFVIVLVIEQSARSATKEHRHEQPRCHLDSLVSSTAQSV